MGIKYKPFNSLANVVDRNIYKDTNMTTRTYDDYQIVRKSIRDNTTINEVDPYDLFLTVRPTRWPNTTDPSEQELLEWVTSDMATFIFEIIGFVLCQNGEDVDIGLNSIKISKLTEDWQIDSFGTHVITIQSFTNVITCRQKDSPVDHVVKLPIILNDIFYDVKNLFDSNYRDILDHYRKDTSDTPSNAETKLLKYSQQIKLLLDGPSDLYVFVKSLNDIKEDMVQYLNEIDKPSNRVRLNDRI